MSEIPQTNTATLDSKELSELATTIKEIAPEFGFNWCGISPIDLGEHGQHLQNWLDKGYHGELDYMAAHGSKRYHPEELIPNTQSIISVRMDYLPPDVSTLTVLSQSNHAYISRYALGRDYHKVMRKRLTNMAKAIQALVGPLGFRAFVDSAPVLERAIAEKSGSGWIGKNTMLINRGAGSYFFLGEIFIDLALPADTATTKTHCGKCTSCIDLCPTGAIVAPYEVDARKCISYLTIEFDGSIPLDLRPKMGNRIFGCDDCQIFCPWNRFSNDTKETDFHPRHQLDNITLLELWAWSEEEFLKNTEGSPIRRTGYLNWLRNIAVALGNSKNIANIAPLEHKKAIIDNPRVVEHIDWAIAELS
jgi:epoxyqueuosine reductase